jgi:hypothetical protein
MAKKKKDQKEENTKTLMRDELENLMTIMESDSSNILPKLKTVTTKEEKEVDIVLEEISNEKQPILPSDKTGKVISTPSFLANEAENIDTTAKIENVESSAESNIPLKAIPPPPPPLPPDIPQASPEPAPVNAPQSIRPSGIVGDYTPIGTLWGNTSVFFMELIDSYAERYDIWEESINQILSILRKMQLLNQQNSEILIKSIEKCHEKIKEGLERFKIKRDYIEKISDTDLKSVTKMLKKTLDLLSLQLKEIKLRSLLDQVFSVYT